MRTSLADWLRSGNGLLSNLLFNWRAAWFLLLLPVALFLPALPIDETRYLAVAWEMHFTGDFLLLHLNGAPYSDKGPLLFWLINVAWAVVGLHVWVVRLGVLALSFSSLLLFERLVLRLGQDRTFATRATLLLSGILYFALFSSAIMFDVLLASSVLVAMHGVLDLDAQRWRRGTLIIALGLGLGILIKGPVVLLDALLVALLAPWWSATARAFKARWYGCIALAVLGAAFVALAWAVPAAMHGGPEYANAIFVRQTVGRVAKSFAHARPFWWYAMVLPLMVLPWSVSLRAPWRAWREAVNSSKAACFGMLWFVPAFTMFCFFSGKQPHYLLPLLPGLALYFASVLGDARARVRGRLFGVLLIAIGLALCAAPILAQHASSLPGVMRMVHDGMLGSGALTVVAGLWPLWGGLLLLLGLALLLHPRAHLHVVSVALAGVAAATIGMLAIAQAVGPSIDVRATAARIRADQETGKPVVHLGWHHGLFEFAGRLTTPLEKLDFADLYTWCAAHPTGEVISFYSKYPIAATPIVQVPYRLGKIQIWRSTDLCAAPHVSPTIKHEDDETPDD